MINVFVKGFNKKGEQVENIIIEGYDSIHEAVDFVKSDFIAPMIETECVRAIAYVVLAQTNETVAQVHGSRRKGVYVLGF